MSKNSNRPSGTEQNSTVDRTCTRYCRAVETTRQREEQKATSLFFQINPSTFFYVCGIVDDFINIFSSTVR